MINPSKEPKGWLIILKKGKDKPNDNVNVEWRKINWNKEMGGWLISQMKPKGLLIILKKGKD